MSDLLPNSDDDDAGKVAAALADAAHAGGLSDGYYHAADAALRRLWHRVTVTIDALDSLDDPDDESRNMRALRRITATLRGEPVTRSHPGADR